MQILLLVASVKFLLLHGGLLLFFFFPFSSPLFEGVFPVCSFQQDLSSQTFLCENLVKRISLLTVLCLLPKDPTIAQDWLFVNFLS